MDEVVTSINRALTAVFDSAYRAFLYLDIKRPIDNVFIVTEATSLKVVWNYCVKNEIEAPILAIYFNHSEVYEPFIRISGIRQIQAPFSLEDLKEAIEIAFRHFAYTKSRYKAYINYLRSMVLLDYHLSK